MCKLDELREIDSQIYWLEEDIANEEDPYYKSWAEEDLQNLKKIREEIVNGID